MMRLKELRKNFGITQKELAERLEVDRTTVIKWEAGKNGATQKTLVKIADLFGVSIEYLLGESDDPTKKDPQPVPGADQMDEQLQQMLALVEKMTDEERNNIISYMKFLAGSKDGGEEETKND